jgi:DNA invertase Pin-like site-specific DNA recombinase
LQTVGRRADRPRTAITRAKAQFCDGRHCGRWDDIDLTSGRLHVRRANGGITTVHPIGAKKSQALRRSVSTGKQAKSGLGIEAQRQAVATYLNGGNWRIIAEFTEVESGKRSDRPALDKALAAARVRQVPLVVAKVDRLTRSVAFLSRLLEAGVDVRFADLPMIEGATGKFLLQQMAAVAELEAGMISARTKAALAAAKRRGVKLGGDRGARLTAKARAAGRAAVI